MYSAVTHVTPRQDLSLALVFDKGEEGILDIKPYLDFGVFSRLKDYNAFRRVRVILDAIEWECGVDLDPEFIYAKSQIADRAALVIS
jgi:hypothetical protein